VQTEVPADGGTSGNNEESTAPQPGVPSCLPSEVFNPVIGSCEIPAATDPADPQLAVKKPTTTTFSNTKADYCI
jgi:hypothetical protein